MEETERGHVIELLPAYALKSLDADEAEMVDRHLGDCARCRAELAAYEKVADMLPLAAQEAKPSPLLKERLLATLKETPAGQKAAAVRPVVARPASVVGWSLVEAIRNMFARVPWQPVALLLIVALAAGNILLWRQNVQDDRSEFAWRRITLTGAGSASEATGIIYISADGRNGTLIVDRLPQLSGEQQYQLWLIQDGQRVSGGVFSVNENGYSGQEIEASRPLKEFTSFGVTIEPTGGSPDPTGARVLEHNL